MKRLVLLFSCVLASGCMGYYVNRPGTSDEDLRARIAKADAAQGERVAAEALAAEKHETESEAAWKKAQADYLAKLEASSPKRAEWFKGVLAEPRVTLGMTEQELRLIVHWKTKLDVKITVRTEATGGPITIWTGVPLPGPKRTKGSGEHAPPLVVSFQKDRVIAVESAAKS